MKLLTMLISAKSWKRRYEKATLNPNTTIMSVFEISLVISDARSRKRNIETAHGRPVIILLAHT